VQALALGPPASHSHDTAGQCDAGSSAAERGGTPPDNFVTEYLYSLAAVPSYGGEHAFKALCLKGFFLFAARAKGEALAAAFSPDGALSHATLGFIYGQNTWVDMQVAQRLAARLGRARCSLAVLPHAGHHVYLDQSRLFNAELAAVLVDRRLGAPAAPLPIEAAVVQAGGDRGGGGESAKKRAGSGGKVVIKKTRRALPVHAHIPPSCDGDTAAGVQRGR